MEYVLMPDPKEPVVQQTDVTPPPGPEPKTFNPGAEWQLIDRMSEPKPVMPEMPW